MANNPGNPKLGTQSVPLTGYFGWTTDADAHDLPEGLSPDNGQVDFLVGSVKQRDGVQNVFAFSGEQTGPNGPTNGTDLPVGSIAWQNPGSITAKDGSYATLNLQTSFSSSKTPASVAQAGGGTAWTSPGNFVSPSVFATVMLTSGSVSEMLAATSMGFAIPLSATITGLQFNWNSGTTIGGCSQSLALVNGGVQISPTFSSTIPTSVTAQQVGGAGNLLSTSLTPAVLNSGSFGVSLGASSASGAVLNMRQATQYNPPSLGSGQQTILFSMPFPVLAGNTLVLGFPCFDFTAGSSAVNVTDNLGNTYHQVIHVQDGQLDMFCYYAHITTGGTCTITIHPLTSAHGNSYINVDIGEFSGFLQPETTDGTNGAFGTQPGNTFNTGTISTANAKDVIFTWTNNNFQPSGIFIPTGYTFVASSNNDGLFGGGPNSWSMAYKQVSATGSYSPTWTSNSSHFNGSGLTVAFKLVSTPTISVNDLNLTAFYTVPGTADTLRASTFNFAVSSDTILGVEIGITGHMTGAGTAQATLTDSSGNPIGLPKTFTFGSTDSRVVLGSLMDSWGTVLTPSLINSAQFGINIVRANGTSSTEWFVDFVDATVAQNPSGSNFFNWIKTYKRTTGNYNLALTKNGILWLEDLQLAPNLLSSVYTGILPNAFAKSTTFDNREFIGLGDQNEGYDMPRQWIGPTVVPPTITPPTVESVTQVNFNPAIWSAPNIPGNGFGNSGQDCFSVWLDADGATCWAFEYFSSGFARFSISDGSIIVQDNLFGGVGAPPIGNFVDYLAEREDGTALFAQDNSGHYYCMTQDGSGGGAHSPHTLFKFHVAPGSAGTLLNGYAVIDGTFDLHTTPTGSINTNTLEDMRWFQSGGTNYVAICTASFGNCFWVFNADTMTFVGRYVSPNFGKCWKVFADGNGNVWAMFSHNSGTTTDTCFLVKWNQSLGVTGTALNAVATNVVDSVIGFTAPTFATFIAANNSVMLGSSINNTGPLAVVSLDTFTRSAFHADDLKLFFNGLFDSPESAFDLGVQPDGSLGIQGDTGISPTIATQMGGIFNVINAETLALDFSLNITQAINAAGVQTPVPTQSIGGFTNHATPPFGTVQYHAPTNQLIVAYEFVGSPVYIIKIKPGSAASSGIHYLDRVSQCGPAYPPSVSFSATQYPIVGSPTGLTQNPTLSFPIGSSNPGSWVGLSAGIGSTAPGSLLQFSFFASSYTLPTNLQAGDNIVLSGLSSIGGVNVNNGVGTNPPFYTLTFVGQPIQGQQYYVGLAFTVPANTHENVRVNGGTTIQPTIATVNTTVAVPNLEVGGNFTVIGAGVGAWDGSYSVVSSANASQLSITSTSLTGGRAYYNFTLISGSTPTAGELVTVTDTNNGNGIFNGNNLVISTANTSQFTVLIASPNIVGAAENGSAIVSGTSFTFDPLKIVGNSGGGDVTVGGANTIAAGVRKVVTLGKTRNGYITMPSPFYQFNTTSGVTSLTVSNIAIMNPEVLERIVAITPANSSNFYYIGEPIPVNTGGINVTYPATVISDNTTTTATFTFTDEVLTGATPIDTPNNNLFNIVELGNVQGFAKYKNRTLAWGEENKIQNFGASLSFNGGIVFGSSQGGGGTANVPLPGGWTIDPTNGFGGEIVNSPVYGLAYQVSNTTGSTQAVIGLISQTAYQDQNNVAIILNNITYGVRIVASCSSGAASGNIVMDLIDTSNNRVYGSFDLPLSGLGETLTRTVGMLLTDPMGVGSVPSVPPTLRLRVYGAAIPAGVTFLIDRAEIFDLNDPVNRSIVRVSYAGNPETYDDSSGLLDISGFTEEAVNDVYVDRDIIYICTNSTTYQTQDNGVGEPGGEGGWTIRQTTEIAGTTSVNGTAAGEEWRILANVSGLFIYWGGEPIPIMQEIQQPWNLINWNAGNTICAFNDPAKRMLGVAVPIPTGPGTASFKAGWFLTAAPNANPTEPNVCLVMSYRQLNSAQAIADSPSIHTTFTGKVTARELSRKWTWWEIPASYIAPILRPDGTTQVVYCSNTHPKIYQQVEGSNDDDGRAINGYYITAGFVRDDTAEARQISEARLIYLFMWMLVSGVGELDVTLLPNTVNSPYANTLLPFPLFENPFFDTECPIQEEGNRLFIRFGTDGVGETFSMSRIVMTLRKAPSTDVTGLDPQGV